jgi:hypothetical protein
MNLVSGLRVTTAAETILAAARDLGVLDLVILGDSALRLRHCTLTDLKITARQRRRGAPLLRQVIPLLDERSESAWESIMRVLHQAAEIPVTPQQEIFDEEGRFIARADLRIDGTRRIHEYDGARHREADVHEVDLERDRALLGARWERHGFTSTHLRRDGATIIADADQLLGRAWNSRRLAAWQGLLDHSLMDGLAAPAPTATGGAPLLKAVRCNKETAAIWVVRDWLREDGSGALLAALTLGELFAGHQSREYRVPDHLGGDDHLRDVIATGYVVHDIKQHLFEDRTQPASARAAQQRKISDRLDRIRSELQFDPIKFEELAELFHKRVARLHQDANERVAIQRAH